MNIPEVKCGIISVSRDCFIISLSQNRRKAIVDAYTKKYGDLYEVPTVVENEKDMLKAVEEAKAAGCNALVVFWSGHVRRCRRRNRQKPHQWPRRCLLRHAQLFV